MTNREETIAHVQRQIEHVFYTVLNDDLLCAEVIAGGRHRWRQQFFAAFSPYRRLLDETMPDLLFRAFERLFVQKHGERFGLAEPQPTASQYLDAVEVDERRPPTQQEIDESWEVESASSEAGRRQMYGEKHPKEVVKRWFAYDTPLDPNQVH
jgi:hypothetical protein